MLGRFVCLPHQRNARSHDTRAIVCEAVVLLLLLLPPVVLLVVLVLVVLVVVVYELRAVRLS